MTPEVPRNHLYFQLEQQQPHMMPSFHNHSYRNPDYKVSDVISDKKQFMVRYDSFTSMKSLDSKKGIKPLSIFARSSFATQVSDSEILADGDEEES